MGKGTHTCTCAQRTHSHTCRHAHSVAAPTLLRTLKESDLCAWPSVLPSCLAVRAGPELPFRCRGLPCSPCAGAFGRSAGGCRRCVRAQCPHRATLPPIRIAMVRTHSRSARAFPLNVGSTQLAGRGDRQGRLSLGAWGMWEQWVQPSWSAGSAGSVGAWRRRRCHFLWEKLGPTAGPGAVSLDCPQGSVRVSSATGQAGSPLTASFLVVHCHRRRVSSGTPCGISLTDGYFHGASSMTVLLGMR